MKESADTTGSGPQPKAKAKPIRDRDGLHKRRGIWHYKLLIDGHWRERSTGTRDYAEAKRVRKEAGQQLEQGKLPRETARSRLSQIAPLWLNERKQLKARNTWKTESHLMKPLLSAFGEKQLRNITAEDLRAYQLKRLRNVKPHTVNRELRVLSTILKRHRVWSSLAEEYTRLPEHGRGPGRALDDAEERRLFETAASRPGWTVAYLTALVASNTAARGCEIKGLRLQDVDLAEGLVRIRRASTKTDAGCRVIPLNTTAQWAIAQLLKRAASAGATEPNQYLLPSCERGRIDPNKPQTSWRTAWRNLTERAGLKGLRFHDLRHHGITRLAEAGVPDQTLMAIAGHVSREMLDHYSHVRQVAKRQAVDKINSYRPAEATGDDSSTATVN